MKRVKLALKRILIIYVVFYLLLASISSCFAKTYDEACGEFVSQYARDFIAEYCTPLSKTNYSGIAKPTWSGGSMGQGIFNCCCTAGVWYMYQLALGIDLYQYGYNSVSSTSRNVLPNSPNWKEITSSTDLKAGDVLIHTGHSHTEMYIGNGEHANWGNSPYSGHVYANANTLGTFRAFRLVDTIEVFPSGTLPKVSGSSAGTKIDYGDFFFNGIPDGQYSLASVGIFDKIVDGFSNLMQYIVAIIVYILRVSFIGYVSLFDRLLNYTFAELTGTNTTLEETGLTATNADDPTSKNRKVTVESILYNQLKVFDVNLFDNN